MAYSAISGAHARTAGAAAKAGPTNGLQVAKPLVSRSERVSSAHTLLQSPPESSRSLLKSPKRVTDRQTDLKQLASHGENPAPDLTISVPVLRQKQALVTSPMFKGLNVFIRSKRLLH